MFDRDEFKKIQNIISLTNTENIDAIDDILSALLIEEPYRMCSHLIKNCTNLESLNNNFDTLVKDINRGNKIAFYNTIFKIIGNNIDGDLVENVLKVIKDNPSIEEDLMDSFSANQMQSKNALLDAIDNLNILDKSSTVVIWGMWYGSILIPKLADRVNEIVGIDIDDRPLYIAKNRIFPNYKNVQYICDDVFKTCRDVYLKTNLIINTSCEHMSPMKEWKWFAPGALSGDKDPSVFRTPKLLNDCYFAFQSNNMFGIEGHINCVNSIDEFKEQLPERAEVLFQEEVEGTRGTRYMIVGKFNPLL